MIAINMEMPASCVDCPFQMIGDEQDFQCIVADKEFCNIDVNRRQDWCPLLNVEDLSLRGYRLGDLANLAWLFEKFGYTESEIRDINHDFGHLYKMFLKCLAEDAEKAIKAAIEPTHTNPEDSYREGFEK